MILIKHRVNTIENLKKTPIRFGVEIDLRSENGNIYLHHDPFKKGVQFKKWLNHYKHKIIVLNVKEEGLEKKILGLLENKKIKNFFFHDQTFSSLLKNMNKNKVSVRFSEYEELKEKKFLFKKIKWLWLDNFNKIVINKKFYNYLHKNNVKICLVSPELVNKNRKNEIELTYKKLSKKKILPKAVCTKYPLFWEKVEKCKWN
jgi:hypothetical protein